MATKISGREIMRLRGKYSSLARRADGLKTKGASITRHLVSSAEVSASAFTFGAVQGRYGATSVLGVPVDLGAAAALHLAGFMGLGGKQSHHLHAFGDGALASFFFTMGRGVGVNWKARSPAVSGEITDAEMEALSQ